jgi:nitroreductase
MDVKEAIEKRKSIRAYKNKEVSDKIIKELIEAARLAPSGCNRQCARYKIIKDTKTKDKLKKEKVFGRENVCDAPAIILCCYDKNAKPEVERENDDVYGTEESVRFVRDVSIASSFIVLRATELGLGSCYIGMIDKKKAKKILNFTPTIEIVFALTVGYSAEEGRERVRKEFREIVV